MVNCFFYFRGARFFGGLGRFAEGLVGEGLVEFKAAGRAVSEQKHGFLELVGTEFIAGVGDVNTVRIVGCNDCVVSWVTEYIHGFDLSGVGEVFGVGGCGDALTVIAAC